MAKMTDPREMRITAIYAEDDKETIIQEQSYQLTGSWVRYFLDDGAKQVIIEYNNPLKS